MDKESLTYSYYNGVYTSLTGILDSYNKFEKELKKDKIKLQFLLNLIRKCSISAELELLNNPLHEKMKEDK
jgi:hypothetical protein